MAKRAKSGTLMPRGRATRFTAKTRAKIVEFEVSVVPGHLNKYEASGLYNLVMLSIDVPDKPRFSLLMEPEEAYELREDLGRAYDAANRI
jgi:hypothetical protein